LGEGGLHTAAVHAAAPYTSDYDAPPLVTPGGGVNSIGVNVTEVGPSAAAGGTHPPDIYGGGGAGKWEAPHWQHALAEVGLHELWYQPGFPKSFDLQV
jgi:hypothetical protein